MPFKVKTLEDLELIYSILREEYPKNQIDITFNWNTKEYLIQKSDKSYTYDPDVPIDLKIEVIYGDSVTADTPILLKDPLTNQIHIKTIDTIIMHDNWIEYPEFKMFDTSNSIRLAKQYAKSHYKVWCDRGWHDIKKIIRHKTDKKIYRIATNSSCVDVTEDHSLSDPSLNKIKPTDINRGDLLLHSFPDTHNLSNLVEMDYNRAKCFGFFMNNGHIDHDNNWQINHSSFDVLEHYKNLFTEVENMNFSIQTKISNSQYYYILTTDSKKDSIALSHRYRSQFYSGKTRIVPNIIINSCINSKNHFVIGFISASEYPIHPVHGKLAAQGLYYVFKSIGMNIKLHLFNAYSDKYYLDLNNWSEYNAEEITEIFELGNCSNEPANLPYVYDIETECGRFHAGIGEMIVYNTDSVFLHFKYNRKDYNSNRNDTFRIATICGDKLTKEIFKRPPIEMEFEKVFQPFILLTKKRYIAQKYENVKDPFQLKGLDAKGIALTRRDYCLMVKKCYKDIIDTIMANDNTSDTLVNIKKSIAVFKMYIDKIDNYDIDIDDLVVSAMLAKSYKTKPVHVILAEKLKARKEEVQVGDRIPYIFIESNDPKLSKSELGEDPQYAIKNGLKFNRKCYLEQLAKPILGFYKIVLKDHEYLLDEIIEYVNDNLESYGSKKLKPSDFKMEE